MGARERWLQHTVTPEEAGRTVQEILTGPLGLSRRRLQKLTRSRGLRLDGRPAHLARRVRAGEVVSAREAGGEASVLEPVEMPLAIVYEDDDLLLVDKPPFVLVHPTAPQHTATLAHGIAHHFLRQRVRARVRPVHRLDRDTSGLLLVAKTALAHQRLDEQLRRRELRREYLALVHGALREQRGVIDAPIGVRPGAAALRVVSAAGQPARTRFTRVERFARGSLVRLELETGRTHQIRVHLAHLGHPLFGDRQYGAPAADGIRRQALHAAHLAFAHPSTGAALAFDTPLPDDMARLREALRGEADRPEV